MRKTWAGRAAAGITACLLLGMTAQTAFAASDRIAMISLEITDTIDIGEYVSSDDIHITGDSSRYQIDGWRVLNEEAVWEGSMTPLVEIEFSSINWGNFSYIGKKNLRIKGTKWEFVSSRRSNDDENLTLTLKLAPLKAEPEQEATERALLEPDGVASWELNETAGSYSVRLYRDGTLIGEESPVYGTLFSFQDQITQAGSYYYKLRAVSKYDGEAGGGWTQSEERYFDEAAIAAFREPDPELFRGSWSQRGSQWCYVNPGNHLATAQWQQIDGKWYWFDSGSVMGTGWITWNKKQYYCQEDGSMLENGVTPDGYQVGPDGAAIGKEN
ncbi:MAG: hypothetical protein LIP16_14820 [Clostridium sp.]|nr:hypothetical protein [Clostridium sp.]